MFKTAKSLLFCLLVTYQGYSLDKGIGVLVLKGEGNNELNVYSKMDIDSKVLARYSVDRSKGWSEYSVVGKGIKSNNLLEYAYEESGLPICNVETDTWVEVIYGYDDKGKNLCGWIKLEEGKTQALLWRSFLQKQLIFFENPQLIRFYDNINGEAIEFKLEPSEHLTYDYIMKPQAVEGNWMKVEVVTPSDYCDDPSEARKQVVWIKYLNEEGRPLVWYFTRGC